MTIFLSTFLINFSDKLAITIYTRLSQVYFGILVLCRAGENSAPPPRLSTGKFLATNWEKEAMTKVLKWKM